jgi:tetratricopeptide (TPR) repeat protein
MAEFTLKCGGCGADVLENQLENGEICPLCGRAARIKHYQTVAAMPLPQVQKYQMTFQAQLSANPQDHTLNSSLAFCFLKLKLPEKALPFFEKAMTDNFSDPNLYYYAAICLLKGKKAFLAMRPEIDTIERYLDPPLALNPGEFSTISRLTLSMTITAANFSKPVRHGRNCWQMQKMRE